MQEYITRLTKEGAEINKVKFATFYLKNGLAYPGLIAEQKLLSNEIFI